MEAEFKCIQRLVLQPLAFPKNGKKWTFGVKSIVSTISACIFNSINVCLYHL